MTIKLLLRDDHLHLHEVCLDYSQDIDDDTLLAVDYLKAQGIPVDNFSENDLRGYEITLDFCAEMYHTSL